MPANKQGMNSDNNFTPPKYNSFVQVMLLVLVVLTQDVLTEDVESYLNVQLERTSREMVKTLEVHVAAETGKFIIAWVCRVIDGFILGVEAMEFSTPKKIIFPKDYGPAVVFSLFNNVYVLMGIDLYYFVPGEDPVHWVPNHHHHRFPSVNHRISFIKVLT